MIGAIAGDVIGSVYEWNNIKTTEFDLFREDCFFTDDTVLTVAIANSILSGEDYASSIKRIGRRYPNADYGGHFRGWLHSDDAAPYNSWGNGSAMRVSPVGFAFDALDTVLEEAKKSAEVTHNHPEGIKGAQATAGAIFLARTGQPKEFIKEYIETQFDYDLSTPIDDIRPAYQFDVSCQGSVPPAIRAFLESDDFENAVRLAISIGGDSDTIACITGGVAQAFYGGPPAAIVKETKSRLTPDLLEVVEKFENQFMAD
ncbi:MAG: ADP-ribosylglycohydrolase family protein [Candidatus Omnitrophica bacterium]|nr:ADP-ribosylglycohydrolase family protein [Candidatus Omnitrophota bacterium]